MVSGTNLVRMGEVLFIEKRRPRGHASSFPSLQTDILTDKYNLSFHQKLRVVDIYPCHKTIAEVQEEILAKL